MMFKHPFTLAITVDGVPRDPGVFWQHYQDDPYPGGHRYEVVYHSAHARELFRDLPASASSRLDRSTTSTFLHYIYWSLGRQTAEQPWEFVLNTIDTVETTDDTVRIAGECSPFVRH